VWIILDEYYFLKIWQGLHLRICYNTKLREYRVGLVMDIGQLFMKKGQLLEF